MSKVITLSLRDEVEKELRRLAIQKYGGVKGSMAKVVSEAVHELKKKETIDPGYAKFLQVMREVKGKGYGGLIKYKSRDELHER